jgi:uncharacterized Zn ribbon protein
MKILCSLILVSICVRLNAQKIIDWAKYAKMPFKTDSVKTFNNDYVENKIFGNIKNSKADFELRIYTFGAFRNRFDRIAIIKLSSDSVFTRVVYVNRDTYEIGERSDNTINDISTRKKMIIGNQNLIIDSLINAELLTIADQTNLIKGLEKKGMKINNPCKGLNHCANIPIFYELKIGKKVRNFYLIQEFNYEHNIDVKEFLKGFLITKFIKKFLE